MKKRTLRKIRSICIVIFIVLAISFSYNKFNTKEEYITSHMIYTVVPNDTLWKIAKEHNFANEDIRKIVYEIKTHNNIDTNIYPGQTINIPIKIFMTDIEHEDDLNFVFNH